MAFHGCFNTKNMLYDFQVFDQKTPGQINIKPFKLINISEDFKRNPGFDESATVHLLLVNTSFGESTEVGFQFFYGPLKQIQENVTLNHARVSYGDRTMPRRGYQSIYPHIGVFVGLYTFQRFGSQESGIRTQVMLTWD